MHTVFVVNLYKNL